MPPPACRAARWSSTEFTGKERDSETGLDYFGARHYSNSLGRFITPDWSAVPVPVPYADLTDPQSLNQYSYVRNLPTTRIDANGHDGWDVIKGVLKEAYNELVDSQPLGSWSPHFTAANSTQTATMTVTSAAAFLIPGGGEGKVEAKIEAKVEQVVEKEVKQVAEKIEAKIEQKLTRYGTKPESAQRLGEQAANAEAHPSGNYPHGVSTTTNPKPTLPGSTVPRSEIEKHFPVQQTGNNPNHHTVVLPKPVTQAVADIFNKIFWGK